MKKVLIFILFIAFTTQTHAITISNLRCEYLKNPVGLDVAQPRLSWELNSDIRGDKQSAYQILVASTAENLAKDNGDVWNTEKVSTDQCNQLVFKGKDLKSVTEYFWKVRVWDACGKQSEWSSTAKWAMAFMDQKEWKAKWIGYDAAYDDRAKWEKENPKMNLDNLKWIYVPKAKDKKDNELSVVFFRKEIQISANSKIQSAQFILSAYNTCNVIVNSKIVGQAYLWNPTTFTDITKTLKTGDNVLCLEVVQTDNLPAAVIGKVYIKYKDKTELELPIDVRWKLSTKKEDGWDKLGFNDQAWQVGEITNSLPWGGEKNIVKYRTDKPFLPAPYLRKNFLLKQDIKKAFLMVSALGTYEARINGQRVGNDVLAPGFTDFNKRVNYVTYDVTKMLQKGDNAIGAILGRGWYAGFVGMNDNPSPYGGNPRLIAQLEIELNNGEKLTIVTDESWEASFGPICSAENQMGCTYDARLELTGWDKPEYKDKSWKPIVSDDHSKLKIHATIAEPSRRIQEIPANAITEPKPKLYTFDLGQNMVGWVRLKVKGAAGQKITIRHGEMLNPNGTLYTSNLRRATATDNFILKGGSEEILEPYFTFHGFRYVEVHGLTEMPKLDAITGIVVHSDMVRTGNFECSNKLVNQLYSNIIWGQKGNYLEIPTDCPQRDERAGWTGDTQFFIPTAEFNYNIAPFFTRWLTTLCEDQQAENGSYPNTAPCIGKGGGSSSAWGDAALICTYNIFKTYNDTRIVADHFASLERYMDFLASKTKDGVVKIGGFGDWLSKGGSASKDFIDNAYYCYLADLMTEMANGIGKKVESEKYAKLAIDLKKSFASNFIIGTDSLKDASQTGFALGFTMNLFPDALKPNLTKTFVNEMERFNWHLATGFVGTPRLLPALHAAGRDDVAYRVLLQETYPSWLFQVKLGATTMWERWDGWTPDKGFQGIGMNSFNHYAFGAVGEYLYSCVGGISAEKYGYKQIKIQPIVQDGISSAKTSYDCIYGKIATDWKVSDNSLTLNVSIPVNTTATVYIPAKNSKMVTENNKPTETSEGVKLLGTENGFAVFAVESGIYKFKSKEIK